MLCAGTQVDRYVVEHLVGRGGQASVYRVRHHLLGTRHALKVLSAGGPDVQARLVREGRVQARLDPTYVVPVHDVISVKGAPALVLPFVEGCSLEELLLDHRPTPSEVAALLANICLGVSCAHDAGIVHRDLKPGNVMLQEKRGRIMARVADFGLARATGQEVDGEGFDARKTRRGTVMGSPAYAAPEQLVDAARVDHRADLWSLGVMLFELLTGELPFQADTLVQLVRCVRTGAFDDTSVPDRWRPLVRQLLSREPDERPASAAEVHDRVIALVEPASLDATGPVAHAVRQRVAHKAQTWAADDPPTPARDGAPGPTIAPDNHTVELPPAGAERTAVPVESHLAEHNLPRPRDAFVGRGHELATLGKLLAGGARIATVVGAGGSGKTRMVLHFAHSQLSKWSGGVWLCDLSEARTLEGVAFAVAQALQVPLGDKDPVERLGHALAGRGRVLVLLDNAEQVQHDVATALDHWLDVAPEACFVVTSRAVLGVAGEQALPLKPLPASDAQLLFRVRAVSAGRDLEHDEEALAAVDELVHLLDHLPLAIELAAARVRVLPPRKLLARMADRFSLLTSRGGRRDRHATLRATLAWSWDLLDGWEQSTLAQLSVFQGGFDLEAVEQVVALSADAPWALDLVQSLVDKSLVRSVRDDRFDLLMSVQEFAAEALATMDDPDAAQLRHAAWFSNLGSPEALAALRHRGRGEHRAAMGREVHNLIAANRWAVASDHPDLATPTAIAAWTLISRTGPIRTGARLLEETRQMTSLSREQQQTLSYSAGWAAQLRGQVDVAEQHYETALAMAQAHGDTKDEVRLLNNLATLYKVRGRLDDAVANSQKALELATALDDPSNIGLSLGNLGVLHADQGRFTQAREAYERSIELALQIRDVRQEGFRLGNLATLLAMNGDLDGAQPYFERALACAVELGERRSQCIVLANLGLLHHQRGRVEQARQCLADSLKLARDVGDRLQQSVCLGYLGGLAQSQGQLEPARQHQLEALEIALQAGSRQREGIAAGHLGHLHRIAGRTEAARTRLEQALHAHRAIGMTYWQASWLSGLALLDVTDGAFEPALKRIAEAVSLSAPFPVLQAEVHAAQARVLLATGETAAAHDAIQAGHDLNQPGRLEALLHAVSALVWAHESDEPRARSAMQAALREPEHSPPGTEIDAVLRQVRQTLAPERTA